MFPTFTYKKDFSAAISAQLFLGKKAPPEKPAGISKVEKRGKPYEGKVGGQSTHQTSGPQLSGAWVGLTSGNSFLRSVFLLTFQFPGNAFSPWKPRLLLLTTNPLLNCSVSVVGTDKGSATDELFFVLQRMVLIRTYPSYSLGYRLFFIKIHGKNTTKNHSSVYKCKLVWKLVKCKQIT